MKERKALNKSMIESVHMLYDNIRQRYIISIRMASGAVIDLSFSGESAALDEYNHIVSLLDVFEIFI